MTLAAVNRLVHHATIFEINVDSYRRRAALERKTKGAGRPQSSHLDCRPASSAPGAASSATTWPIRRPRTPTTSPAPFTPPLSGSTKDTWCPIHVRVDGPAASCAKVWLSASEPGGPFSNRASSVNCLLLVAAVVAIPGSRFSPRSACAAATSGPKHRRCSVHNGLTCNARGPTASLAASLHPRPGGQPSHPC